MPRLVRFFLLILAIVLPVFSAAQDEASTPVAEPRATFTAEIPADAQPGAKVTATIRVKIQDGWHVYGTKETTDGPTATTVEAVAPLKLEGNVVTTNVETKEDPNFSTAEKKVIVDYLTNASEIQVPVTLGPDPKAGKIQVRYQACNDRLCEMPQTVEVPLSGAAATVVVQQGDVTDPTKLDLLPFAGTAFLAGLLALLTPCVFPMVPITVSYFAKRREAGGNGLVQAGAYCFGIVAAFAAFGLLVTVLFGASGIQQFATNPWVNLALAALFIWLALNLFGIIQVSLPAQVTNAFNPSGKAGLVGPILMGLTFTLTSFTCTVPFISTVLVSAASGDIVRPLIGMLAFGTAFALPFFLLALFPQFLAKMPKSGSWLEMVKAFMGFLEIAAAVKFISNADLVWGTALISRSTFLIVWIVIFAAAGLFLLRVIRLPKVDIPEKIGRGRAVTLALTGLICVWLGFGVAGRSLGELEAFLPPGGADGWNEIPYDRALTIARRDKKPLLIDFTGVTCTNCRWMEKNMFPRPGVKGEFENYVLVKLYTDRNTPEDRANQKLMQRLTKKVTLPSYVIVTPEEKVLKVFEGSTRDESEFVTFLKPAAGSVAASLPPRTDGWKEIPYSDAVTIARRDEKPLLIDFTGVTNGNRWMEKNVFPRPGVKREFGKYTLVRLYTDRNTVEDRANRAIMRRLLKKDNLPTYAIVTPQEKVLKVFEGSTRNESEFVAFLKSDASLVARR
ncbi:MAG: cytochrome c biogenesis protein CcdA [Fimbriimonas sp.]